jgi:hypothetical protein
MAPQQLTDQVSLFVMKNFIAQFGSIIFAIGLAQACQFVLTTLVNPRQPQNNDTHVREQQNNGTRTRNKTQG